MPAPGAPTARAGVELGTTPGTYSATVAVDRPGPWELAVSDGQRVTRIPFVVPIQAASPPERAVYGGLLAAGVLLLVSVVVATRARRGAWALLPAAGLVAAMSVALTGAVLSASLPLPPQPGDQLDPTVDNVTDPYAVAKPLIADFSRPPVTLDIEGGALVAGQASDVELNLTDGATGTPVDDLLVHDDALVHLLLVGPTGQLWHLHPIRIAPGHYQQHLSLPTPGHYALSAEMVRRGGGVQLVRAAVGLDAAPPGTTPGSVSTQNHTAGAPIHLGDGQVTGSTVIDAIPITVAASRAMTGSPTTITARAGDTPDLQPWLGMVGHMIVAGPLPLTGEAVGAAVQNVPVWAHAHSMGAMTMAGTSEMTMPMSAMPMSAMPMSAMPMAGMGDTGTGTGTGMSAMTGLAPVNGDSAADETVAAYGPDVPFTYTFPTAGQYRLWIQLERDFTVLTVPVVLEVAASAGHGVRQ